ncbi:MAG TPA: hypothetical protein VNW46_02845 [Gemmatimonadaceae bacterium]|jgi:hypothetical protein|nr:hypothetical protein [Gemmatimonadaceae bacterium]
MRAPLGYDQIAPLGFIALVKIGTMPFGSSDLGLRVVPFLCGIAALVLFWRVAARALDGIAIPIAVGLFAIGIPFIRYTTELKQYGCDLVATLALTLVALDLRRRTPTVGRCVAAGMAGCILVWFSQAAVLVLVGLGAALTVCSLLDRDPSSRRAVRITVPIWAVAAIAALVVSKHYVAPATLAYMHMFWGKRQSFAPLPLGSSDDVRWVWTRFTDFFGTANLSLAYPGPMLYALLTVLGFVVMWRRRRDTALILLAPFVVTLMAAVAQQYPFRTRLVLFLMPSLLLALAEAIGWIGARAPVGRVAAMALIVPPLVAIGAAPPPYSVEAYKPVLAYVQTHRRPGDAVYVFANTAEALLHYGPQFGLDPGTYVVGRCEERDVRPYLRDLDPFRGASRLWVIGSNMPPFRQPRRAIGQYLQTIGVRRDSIAVPSPFPSGPPFDPVSADLFDLSDSARLQLAAASTFRVGILADTLHGLCSDRFGPTGKPRGTP